MLKVLTITSNDVTAWPKGMLRQSLSISKHLGILI